MRLRKTENRDLPPGMVRRKRPRKNGTVWIGYYYRAANGKQLSLGGDLDKTRLKRAELESKAKPADLKIMKGIFDRYERDIIPKKAPRTQKDNKAELKHLRKGVQARPHRCNHPIHGCTSEITDIADASLLLGHSEQEITKRVYRRIGAVAQPSK